MHKRILQLFCIDMIRLRSVQFSTQYQHKIRSVNVYILPSICINHCLHWLNSETSRCQLKCPRYLHSLHSSQVPQYGPVRYLSPYNLSRLLAPSWRKGALSETTHNFSALFNLYCLLIGILSGSMATTVCLKKKVALYNSSLTLTFHRRLRPSEKTVTFIITRWPHWKMHMPMTSLLVTR
jgi:hypothetical protein